MQLAIMDIILFLPFNSKDKEKCLSCNIIEHCKSFFGNIDDIFCLSCESGFDLQNNKCDKKPNTNIPMCKKEIMNYVKPVSRMIN